MPCAGKTTRIPTCINLWTGGRARFAPPMPPGKRLTTFSWRGLYPAGRFVVYCFAVSLRPCYGMAAGCLLYTSLSGVLGEKHALVVGGLPTFAPSRRAGRNCLDSLSFSINNELFALLIRGFPSKLSVEKPQETRNPRNGRDFVHAALVACRSVPPRRCQRGRRRGRRGHHGDRGSKEQGAMRAELGLARAGKRYTACLLYTSYRPFRLL